MITSYLCFNSNILNFAGGRKLYNNNTNNNNKRTPQTIRIPRQDLSDPQAIRIAFVEKMGHINKSIIEDGKSCDIYSREKRNPAK